VLFPSGAFAAIIFQRARMRQKESVLLDLVAGSKEDGETVTRFFENMKLRGLKDPLLVTSDGAPGAAQLPEDAWPEFKVRAQACYHAPSRAIARELTAGLVADYGKDHERAVACFTDDFEACIAHLRFPVTRRRAIRTTNLLEVTDFERRQIAAIRKQLDDEYEAHIGTHISSPVIKKSSKMLTRPGHLTSSVDPRDRFKEAGIKLDLSGGG
jgi:transposase-like protein